MSPATVSKSLGKGFAGFKLSDQNIKLLIYFIIGVAFYLVVTGKLRNARSEAQYDQAGTDPHTNFAIGIRQSCNPSGIGWMIDMDFTFKNDLMLIADQISDVDKVAAAYKRLYNGEIMYERLEKELDVPDYQEWIRRARAAPTAAPVPGSVAAKSLIAVRDTTVFEATDSTKVAKTVKAGQVIGKKLKSYTITSKGVKSTYHLVTWTSWIFLTNQGLVKASDTKEE